MRQTYDLPLEEARHAESWCDGKKVADGEVVMVDDPRLVAYLSES